MGTVSKITGTLATSISKISGVAISGVAKVIGQIISLFTDDNAVTKANATGTSHGVYISSCDANYNFDHDQALTVSFWIKVGWDTNLNTNTHLFSSSNQASGNVNNDTYRFWYDERYNRIYGEWRVDASNKRQNFWLFHSPSGNYNTARLAAGLHTGSGTGGVATYWLSTNRGNANSDGYTLITITRGTTNSAASSNFKLYWNATDCGVGHYASGNHTGTPTMGTETKQIALGSNSWSFTQGGDSTETKFNGVTIWNKVLNSSEISDIYNGGTPTNLENHSAVANLKGFWNFESTGNNTVDGAPAFTINGDSGYVEK